MAEEKKNQPVTASEEILDFSGVTPFEPLDSSITYLVKTSNLENAVASTGKKMAVAEMTIVAPEECFAENWEPDEEGNLVFAGLSDRRIKCAGRKLFRNFTKTPEALPFLYNYLKAMDPDVVLNEAFRFRPAEWIGMELAVKGSNEAYEEQVRLRPNNVYPATRYKG